MNSNKKFVILLEILVIAFLVMSVVPVCGLTDSSADISAYPSIVNPGDEITVTYSAGFEFNRIVMYKVDDPNEEEYYMGYYFDWYNLASEKSGTLIFTAPDEPGDYEFRLFEDDGYTDIARSNIVRVQEGTTVPTPAPTTLSGVHHLGDNTLSDWEVPKPEGTEYTTTFSLATEPATSADLTLNVFQTNYNNPVLVNGKSVGILCKNPIKSWKQCTIKIPGSALRVGSNTLTIQSESRGGNYDDFMIRNIVVTPSSGVHHLGDQTVSDWEVPKPEGTEYTTTFSLTAVPASADLTLDVFQIDHNDPVLVNGNSIGILCKNPIKSWKQCTIKIPGSALRVGSNTLTIQSESRGGNYDDFMIRNIEVTPSSGVHHLGDNTLSDWEVPKPEGTEYTTTFSLTAVPASADLILDVFDTDYNNPVLVNGNSVGILCINTIESWKQCTIKIPGSVLRVGSNTLTIQSESRGGNYDDFMIRNIGLTPSSDAQPTTPTPTTECGTFWAGVQEPSLDELPEFIFGNLETFDFDNDGSEDRIVYTFEPEEVAEDLFLDKSIEVEKAPSGSGYSKELILRFENTGDGTVEYQHIEYIPKSFAESVNDLEFSRPPDRIIEEDPVLEWVISLPGKAIEVVTSCLPIFNFYPMDVDTFAAMSQTEKCDWIKKQIGPHINTIDKTAKKHNIPPWLLATVILNELADYDFKDQFQELIFSRGSVGMAQINVRTAQRHNLVDMTEEDITKSLETPETLPVKPQEDPFQSVGPMQPGEAEFSLEEYLQLKRECAIDHITWERLNQPEYAIEGAAREIEYIINNVNQNLDKTWPKSLLNGSIDRNDLYANIKMQIPNERNPDERRILRKEGLALLVIAAYNTDTIPESNFELSSPYHKREKGQNFFNAINHANNGVDLFVRLLEDCGHFVEEEEEDTSDGEFYCPIPIPNEAAHIVEDYSEYWSTPNGFVGPYYRWYDREKTKKWSFSCYNAEGKLHGVYKSWYEDGAPRGEGNYEDGKKQGVCKSWYEDGTPRSEWNYKDGKVQGVCKEWYYNGTPKFEWNYKDGKNHGVCKDWSVNGKLTRECNYEEGKCVSCVHGHC